MQRLITACNMQLASPSSAAAPAGGTSIDHVCDCRENGSSTGYLRLTVFSQNAPADVEEALRSLQKVCFWSVLF